MPPVWSFAELRTHIKVCFPERCREITGFLDSIDRSTLLLKYHANSAKDALKDFVDESDPSATENMKLVFGISDNQARYDVAKIANEAHIIGAIHTARSLLDMFSQLSNGLLLNSSIPIKDCTIQKVHNSLPDSNLRASLHALLESYWFKYISAFINTVKHRNLIQHSLSLSFHEGIVGISIGSFDYRNEHFDKHWGMNVLKGVEELCIQLVNCGATLNEQLGLRNVVKPTFAR